jgi:hypothetical protein
MAQPSAGFGGAVLGAFRDLPADDTSVLDDKEVGFPRTSGAPSEGVGKIP